MTTTGDEGIVTFTPDDCGETWCSLDRELATGSSFELSLSGAAGLTLVSDNPYVAVVFPLAGSRWHVAGVAPGRARLMTVDGRGAYIDGTDVDVAPTDHLALEVTDGPAHLRLQGPEEQVWSGPAAQALAFRVRPYASSGAELMGKLALTTQIDAELFDAVAPGSDLATGEISLRPMFAGDYWMTVFAQDAVLDLTFEIR